MKDLSNEILNIESECVDDDYKQGFNDGLVAASELINKWEKLKDGFEYPLKKNNDEEIIEELKEEINKIKEKIRDLNFEFNGY
jgi:hypothetical protein